MCDDVAVADWLGESLRPWTPGGGIDHVASILPAAFPAHGRILHRAISGSEGTRWADIAATTGTKLDAETSYDELVGWRTKDTHQAATQPRAEPDRGSLSPDECGAVAEVLARHTTTPDLCWFCIWDGFNVAPLNRLGESAPRVAFEHRSCLLFRGPVAAATAFQYDQVFQGSTITWFQSPTWWWPDDRAWCVASELDIYSTYVAGTSAAVRALIDHPTLEVIECNPEHSIDLGPYRVTPRAEDGRAN